MFKLWEVHPFGLAPTGIRTFYAQDLQPLDQARPLVSSPLDYVHSVHKSPLNIPTRWFTALGSTTTIGLQPKETWVRGGRGDENGLNPTCLFLPSLSVHVLVSDEDSVSSLASRSDGPWFAESNLQNVILENCYYIQPTYVVSVIPYKDPEALGKSKHHS